MNEFSEVFSVPKIPSLESVSEGADAGIESINRFAKSISQKILKLIYDEEQFKNFIHLAQIQGWVGNDEIELCLKDLEKQAPQELLTLWMETEAIATPLWWATFSLEVGSGDLNVLRTYVLGSVIRSLTSYGLSKDVVEHRGFTASIEAIPHVGRVAPLIALAEEHPELTRMFWAYNACRKPLKKAQKEASLDLEKVALKFAKARNSKGLEFIIEPKKTTRAFMQQYKLTRALVGKIIEKEQS